MRYLVVLALFWSFLLACTTERNISANSVYLGKDSSMQADKLVKNGTLYPLKESSGFLVGDVDKVIMRTREVYVLDSKKAKSIFKFSIDGNPIAKFSKQGGGPDEYYGLADFDISNKEEIAVLSTNNKILLLDSDFNNKKSFTVKDVGHIMRICFLDSYVYVYCIKYGKASLKRINTQTEIVEDIWESDLLKSYVFNPVHVFSKDKNDIYFFPPGYSTLFKLNENRCAELFSIEYSTKTNALEFYGSKNNLGVYKSLEELSKVSIPTIEQVSRLGDKILFTYVYQFFKRFAIVDIKNLKVVLDVVPQCEYLGRNQDMVSVVYKREIESSEQLRKYTWHRRIDKQDGQNPILIKFDFQSKIK